MSDLKVDGIIASTGTNTALTLQGKGSGKVDIGDGALSFPDADGDADQVIKTDGSGALAFVTPAAAGWNVIGTEEAGGGSGTATLDVTGLSSTYDTYAIGGSDLLPITDNVNAYLRIGDSSGIDSGASDYAWMVQAGNRVEDTSCGNDCDQDDADAQMILDETNNPVGGATGEGIGFMLFLHRPGDGTTKPMITGETTYFEQSTSELFPSHFGGARVAVITVDRVQFLFHSGNVESGRLTVWGLAHA